MTTASSVGAGDKPAEGLPCLDGVGTALVESGAPQQHTPQHLEPGTSSCTTFQIHDKELHWIRKIDLPICLLVPPPLYSVATSSQDLYYLLPYL